MTDNTPWLTGKHVLAVDDEPDILETITDILDDARLDTARDYDTASAKIRDNAYDLVILDIMGVNGLKLLEEAVAKGMPAMMLTAHAINPETLMASIRKGALSYLPKETLADLDTFINDLFDAEARGVPAWKLLFERLGDFFDQRFGAGWRESHQDFWADFERTYSVGRGISARLLRDDALRDKTV